MGGSGSGVSLSGPVDPSFRALYGRLKFTVRCHMFNKDSLALLGVFSSSPLLSNLELSVTKVYEPAIRALLGTASHFYEVVYLKWVGVCVKVDEMSGSVCLDVINQSWSPMFGLPRTPQGYVWNNSHVI